MTYCVGLLVEDGLALIADTRTNAGVDNISSYRKLHVSEVTGERVIAVATAGNLSVTQTAMAMVREGIKMPGSEEPESLLTAPTLFRAAQLVGHAIKLVRYEIAPSLEAETVNADASVLIGGQIGDGPISLYMVYSQGNFIECQPDTPYLQIGEFKYGKPILDRALRHHTPLPETVKLGLISFDSTLRSNVSVGLPLDMIVLRKGERKGDVRRIEAGDPYFQILGQQWSRALAEAQHAMPSPPWLDEGA
ncbi:peptidase [Brevundimonas pishanensis]|uniref:peptidase n=1 Tax=Brevundimonas pishanensis TaxID=2896315 RepID=UPI001FA74A57|nr:peptidase [Brevundimonas pishanensis]